MLEFKYLAVVLLVLSICINYLVAEQLNTNETNNVSENDVGRDRYAATRSLLTNMAQSFLARQGSSQIISLNLTNLFILVILKALIYAAGSLGAGHWKHRSLEDESWQWPTVSETELLLFVSYLTGEPGHYDCLYHTACKNPKTSLEYLNGAKLMIRAANSLKSSPIAKNSANYEELFLKVKEAIEYGRNGGNCEMLYKCSSDA